MRDDGVETVAMAGWPILRPYAWNGFVSVNGAPPGPVLAFFLPVSPGWMDTMKIQLLSGRDFRPNDTAPGVAIVNETFVKQYFNGENPIGQYYARGTNRFQVIGVLRDIPYRSLREAPARTYGLWPRKGRLAAGADADIVLVNPTGERTLRNEDVLSKAGWTPFHGRAVQSRSRSDRSPLAAMSLLKYTSRLGRWTQAVSRYGARRLTARV